MELCIMIQSIHFFIRTDNNLNQFEHDWAAQCRVYHIVTGKTISVAGNKWYYRAQRRVIGPNGLEINLNSHRVGYINIYCITECLMLLGDQWGGRDGGEGRREHCHQLPPRSWHCSHFLLLPMLNDSRLKELLKHRQCGKKVAIRSLLTLNLEVVPLPWFSAAAGFKIAALKELPPC